MSDDPDFYIYGREGAGLSGVRSCWKLKTIRSGDRDVLVVRVSPKLEGLLSSPTTMLDVVGLSQRVKRPFDELLKGSDTVVVVWEIDDRPRQTYAVRRSIGTASLLKERPMLDADGHVVPKPPKNALDQFRRAR